MNTEDFTTLLQNSMLTYNNYTDTLKEIIAYQNQNQKLQQH